MITPDIPCLFWVAVWRYSWRRKASQLFFCVCVWAKVPGHTKQEAHRHRVETQLSELWLNSAQTHASQRRPLQARTGRERPAESLRPCATWRARGSGNTVGSRWPRAPRHRARLPARSGHIQPRGDHVPGTRARALAARWLALPPGRWLGRGTSSRGRALINCVPAPGGQSVSRRAGPRRCIL